MKGQANNLREKKVKRDDKEKNSRRRVEKKKGDHDILYDEEPRRDWTGVRHLKERNGDK